MGYFNINSILYNLRKIFKYLSFSLLIVAFIVIALLLMQKNSYCIEYNYNDNLNFYVDDYVLYQFQNSIYNSDDYRAIIWQWTRSGGTYYSILAVPSSFNAPICDYDTTTGVFTLNSNLTNAYWIRNDGCNFEILTYDSLSYFSPVERRTPLTFNKNNVSYIKFWGTPASFTVNGNFLTGSEFPVVESSTSYPLVTGFTRRSAFSLVWSVDSIGNISVTGLIPSASANASVNHSYSTNSTASNYTNILYNDPDYIYIPFIMTSGSSVEYCYVKIPKTSSDLVYYAWNTTNTDFCNSVFFCNSAFQVYNSYNNVLLQDSPSGGTYTCSLNNVYFLCTNYTDSTLQNVDFELPELYPSFTAPYISLPNNSTANYISGEFQDFLVVGGNDVVGTGGTNALYFFYYDYDTPWSEYNTIYLILDENSPYYLNNYENNHIFVIPKNIIPYVDGHEYRMQLTYMYNGVLYNGTEYIWTTDFSDQAILNDEIRSQDQLNNGINDINNFLNNNNYDSNSIVNNMPSSSQYSSPTDNGIDTIFTSLYNAFTTTGTTVFRFYIPFTNDQYIDIPSDIVSSRLPSVIVTLIQTVYWFVICRFIVKDIAGIAQKAKSGEILNSSGDDNIKTDLL